MLALRLIERKRNGGRLEPGEWRALASAYAAFEEKEKGSLEPAKMADFVVLSQDIMKVSAPEILRTEVRMTVVGGAIVYQAK